MASERVVVPVLVVALVGWLVGGGGCREESAGEGGGAAARGVEADVVVLASAGRGQWDLGYVEPNSRHEVAFALQNDGPGVLAVGRVKSQCECQRLLDKPARIEPGQTGLFRVEFVAPADPVAYDKWLAVLVGESAEGMLTLGIVADVGLPLTAGRVPLEAGQVPAGGTAVAKAVMRNRGAEAVRLIYAVSSSKELRALVPGEEIGPGGSVEVPVEVRPGGRRGAPRGPEEGTPAGPAVERKGSISVHTDCPTQPVVSFEVRYNVVSTSSPSAANSTASESLTAPR